MFDNNIAYEIRLPKALESDILCPFHYFGVTDYTHDGVTSDDFSDLKDLTSDERIKHIIEKTNYYGYSGSQLKGLIFVSGKEEATEIAEKLSLNNIPSKALIGSDTQNKRTKVINELINGKINYIVTVNLFNEGIDIPEVNQIVMLRSTQSSIIFTQQLGRGLRKSSEKEFVTIIDFIGNYENNYLIPIALSDNQSHNKDDYRKFLTEPNKLSGVSTINFEEIAKKKIFKSIDHANLNSTKIIKEAFESVKERTGRIPMLSDFITQNSIDPKVIISKFNNYYLFLKKYNYIEKDFNKDAVKNLTFLSKELLPGLKQADYKILESIISENDCASIPKDDLETSLNILSLNYFGKNENERYGSPIIDIKTKSLSTTFSKYLEDEDYQAFVLDILAIAKYYNDKIQDSGNDLILYNQYTRLDFLKLVNWRNHEKNMANNIYGYRILDEHIPLFITYHKSENIDDGIKYEDHFINQEELVWISRKNVSLSNKEIQQIINHKATGKTIYIFVKKNDSEGSQHYYLGEADYVKGSANETTNVTEDKIVTMNFVMKTPIRDDIYRYLVN